MIAVNRLDVQKTRLLFGQETRQVGEAERRWSKFAFGCVIIRAEQSSAPTMQRAACPVQRFCCEQQTESV